MAACRRLQRDGAHRDQHIVDDGQRALARNPAAGLAALEAMSPPADPVEAGCRDQAIAALRAGGWEPEESE